MEAPVQKRLLELANRAYERTCFCFTAFLDLSAQSELNRIRHRLPPVPLALFGGADGCERVVARFGDPELCGYEEAFPVTCLHVTPLSRAFAEPLTHRDFLGALMGLGIERELLGDIIVRENEAWLFCLSRIAPWLEENFTQAKHTFLSAKAADVPQQGELFRLAPKSCQLTGERLDALIAHVYQLSRSDAQTLFAQGKVFVQGAQCDSTSYVPKPGEIVSVRGFGRFRYSGVSSLSKKGKLNVQVEMYV